MAQFYYVVSGAEAMALDKNQIKLVARLTALEILVQHLLVMVTSAKHDPVAELRACRDHVLRKHSQARIKDFEIAASDLVAQEMTEALDTLLSEAITQARESRPPQSPDFSPVSRRK
jgi:hypothetical protein